MTGRQGDGAGARPCHRTLRDAGRSGRRRARRQRQALAAVTVLSFSAMWPAAGLAVEADDADDALAISNARVDDHPQVSVTVNAPLSAIDADVPADAFTLLEDGSERDVEVERLRSEDLEIALIIDISGSMEGAPLEAAQQAAAQFTADMPAAVPVSVIAFSTDVTVLSDFTTDRADTNAALDGLTSQAWTSLYDALHAAMDLFEDRDPDRRAVVMLTDGGDNRSAATLEETAERLGSGDKVLHIVELITTDRPEPRERFGRDEPGVDEADLAALQMLADAAGQGSVVSPEDLDAISAVYEQIAATLMNQYELTYTSEAYDSAQVTVRLEHDGTVVEGMRDVDLPPAPATDEPEAQDDADDDADADIAEPEEPQEPAEAAEPEEPEAADDGVTLPGADLMDEPWVVWATIAAVLGGVAFLAYYLVDYLRWRN